MGCVKVCKDSIECDILVVGGGIGGLMAAIRGAEMGVKVVVAEKADTRRSGSGATGNDHFLCYIPEYHGDDMESIVHEVTDSLYGKWQDISILRVMMERSFDVVKMWDSYGILMRPHGEWEFNGHAMPGRPLIHLKYDGRNQKSILTKEAQKRGVKIINKMPIAELLTDQNGNVVGAMGVNIAEKEPQIVVFKAKAVILTAGNASRLYPGVSPAYLFNVAHCPGNTGSGQAMAFRAGACLVNLDIPYAHAGTKYFARCGKATWIGVLKDYYSTPIGPFVTKPSKEFGDVTADIWTSVFREKMANGTGPTFMDCSETAEEDLRYMFWGLECEGDSSVIDYMQKYNIDIRKHMVEFTQYEPMLIGRGIEIDQRGAASIPGLYAAGDLVGNFRSDISGAAVWGVIAVEYASEYIKNVDYADVEGHKLISEKVNFYGEMLNRNNGSNWHEANVALQQIMRDYAGNEVRSESLLCSGLKYLKDLRKYAIEQLKVANSHELMRALEVFDLMDMGELIMLCARERKETRENHKRSDYTFTNPLLNNMFQTIQKTEDGVMTEFRKRI